MPEATNEQDEQLCLLSIDVLISHVQIDLNVECHLPCVVFRLLDYPAVSIPYFDQWEVEEFRNLKKHHPRTTWRQLLSDQFYELRSANGKFNFKRGKSCLFKSYFKTLYGHLLSVPLFVLLIDQINDSSDTNKSHFVGSCNVKLNELIEKLNQSIKINGNDVPLVEQETFHSTLFNLMGTTIGTCDIAVRFCHYGSTILTHLPALQNEEETKTNQAMHVKTKEQITKPNSVLSEPKEETVVKQIHIANEKKDVALQLTRSNAPPASNNNRSVQTRWTSTASRKYSERPYLRTIEDPSFDDQTISFYQPPPLYYNSHSDFLHMTTPSSAAFVEQAKENRLAFLASIPIRNVDDQSNAEENDENEEHKSKRKPSNGVRFNSTRSTQSKSSARVKPSMPNQMVFPKDFLSDFPLLRSLVEEAMILQHRRRDATISTDTTASSIRPHTAVKHKQNNLKLPSTRPISAKTVSSVRTKSVIVPRNVNISRRLHFSSAKSSCITVTKEDVRNLVNRLSKPKANKRIEQETDLIDHNTVIQVPHILSARTSPKPNDPLSATHTIRKPPLLSYGTTRAHRLMTELSRARRAATSEPHQAVDSPKSHATSTKDPIPVVREPLLSSQMQTGSTIARLSLLNKVEVDTPTPLKQNNERPSSENLQKSPNTSDESKSSPSSDDTLKLNQTITKLTFSTNEQSPPKHDPEEDEWDIDLAFSITDITDYFTDGNGTSNHP